MRAVVTGCAGFIGSSLCDALIARGDYVVGIDCFTTYYDQSIKRSNIEGLTRHKNFELHEIDLRDSDIKPLLDGADTVFHHAAQPGVRLSWSTSFDQYATHNISATQRLLEAALVTRVGRLLFASSSSVYGQTATYPSTEEDVPRPHSPYGVTKLAAEHLCRLYAANWGLSTIALRYFTVYGPRQRPDMAIYRILDAGLARTSFPLYGDGSARRDFTYVGDVVRANLAAADADLAPGTVINVAGGDDVTMVDLLRVAGDVLRSRIEVEFHPSQAGDVSRTGGATDLAVRLLGWSPTVSLGDGLAAQAAWQRTHSPNRESGR